MCAVSRLRKKIDSLLLMNPQTPSTPESEYAVTSESAGAAASRGDSHHLSDVSILSPIEGNGTEMESSLVTHQNENVMGLDSSLNSVMDINTSETYSPIDSATNENVVELDSSLNSGMYIDTSETDSPIDFATNRNVSPRLSVIA
ncbi:hypothetical protein QAD02_000188 [Eretmocerus hayati]|uniref:Uncharacterized protein n=1 Tax=Eretmocerus hayati TaxID=131215 RepID=A0ACC2NF10_9HYME|nr:hypothetical protein QAD02_000188 [Eretmocerus hayati]